MGLPLQILILALSVNPGTAAAATCGTVLSVIDFESPLVSELKKGYPDVDKYAPLVQGVGILVITQTQ